MQAAFSGDARAWEQLGAVWATAVRLVGRLQGVEAAPSFQALMDSSVAALARKPVRARSFAPHPHIFALKHMLGNSRCVFIHMCFIYES